MDDKSNLQSIRKVRTIGLAHDDFFGAEREVNEAISLGWILLHVQTGKDRPLFVIGWNKDDEPRMTENEARHEEWLSGFVTVES